MKNKELTEGSVAFAPSPDLKKLSEKKKEAEPEVVNRLMETDKMIVTSELRWKNGKLQQLWKGYRTDRLEWREVPTAD